MNTFGLLRAAVGGARWLGTRLEVIRQAGDFFGDTVVAFQRKGLVVYLADGSWRQ